MHLAARALALALALSSTLVIEAAAAEAYPARPVRMIVPYAAGGSSDAIARMVAAGLTQRLGQQFVVDNRAGAGTIIGTEIAAHATADGYTLFVATPPLVINPSLHRKVSYDPARDFSAITNMAASSNLLVVHPSVPAHDVRELVALLRAQPKHYTYGSSGIGGASHLAMALFEHMTKVELVHVPYKGGAPAVADLLAGRLDLAMANLTTALPHLRAGRLKGLAIGTIKRSPLLPDMPTIAEAGVPGYEANNWNGLVVPRGTPQARIEALHAAVVAVLHDGATATRIAAAGLDAIGDTPAEFARYLKSEGDKWAQLIKAAHIRAE
jgi:tripartite-type tricarboxylate transporter receptor subunit TctC